jgi:urocanate hydratase
MASVCDRTPAASERIPRALWNDPTSGVMRHADSCYEPAWGKGQPEQDIPLEPIVAF